ncbi:MAG: chitobiase/beta-hexosaminidase C-terminal domain-containing protein, partial [bacterium]|nr:chitobiase/beta-hexosaminidase C-terminal domain-containing protein [bacterium]
MKRICLAIVALFTFFAVSKVYGETHRFDLRSSSMKQTRALSFQDAPSVGVSAEASEVLRMTSLAAGVTKTSPLAVGDVLTFSLFDDVTVTLTLQERTASPLGNVTFLASTAGAEGFKTAVVIQTEAGLQVDIQNESTGLVYSIFSTEEKTIVKELNPAVGEVEHLPSLLPPDPPRVATSRSIQYRTTATTVEQPSTLVDILVAYDQGGAMWAEENSGGLEHFAEIAVQKMNVALANSGLSSEFRFRLVGVVPVETTETDLNTALYAAQTAKVDDGTPWSVIPAMRDEVGADIVTVLIDIDSSSGAIGLAYALSSNFQNALEWFDVYAFNACSVRAVSTGHTMTHEVGHNIGAGHSKEQTTQSGPQLYEYSAGCYFTGTDQVKYHTIMAYNFDGHGNFYTPAPVFSSPEVEWRGVPAGREDADNVRTIRQTFAAASAWREQVFPTTYDVFFSPGSGEVFDGQIQVELAPGKAGLPVYYTLDGTDPTQFSSRYTGPITLTSTTTIKAVAEFEGNLGPVCEATYVNEDLASALDALDLVWTTSSDAPWIFQTERSYDGVAAAQSGQLPQQRIGETSWLKTSVEGPATMSFRYRQYAATKGFTVTVGNETVLAESESEIHYHSNPSWAKVEISIPEGTHEVTFAWTVNGGVYQGFNGVWLDTVSVVSEDPVLGPCELYATVNGDKAFSTLQWTNEAGDVTYTEEDIDWARVKTAEVSVRSGTLTLDKVPTGSGTFDITSTAKVKLPVANRLGNWKVTGSGIFECNHCFPTKQGGLTEGTWQGTVELSGNIDLNSTTTSLEALGHEGSKLLISGTVSGYLAREKTCTVPLELTGTLTIDDGYSNTSYTFAKLTGTGTFTHSRDLNYTIVFTDISGFTGSLNITKSSAKIVIGANTKSAPGAIVVSSGKVATLGSTAEWSAPNGVILYGTLAGSGTITGNVTFNEGSTLDVT